jgi:hypothetical protein
MVLHRRFLTSVKSLSSLRLQLIEKLAFGTLNGQGGQNSQNKDWGHLDGQTGDLKQLRCFKQKRIVSSR